MKATIFTTKIFFLIAQRNNGETIPDLTLHFMCYCVLGLDNGLIPSFIFGSGWNFDILFELHYSNP